MTIEQTIDNFGKVVNDLKTNYNGQIMVRVGMTALTLIKKRVQETGVNAKGQKFPAYSTKDTLVGCKSFYKKSACQALLGSKQKRKALEWRTVGGSSGYAAYLNVSAGGTGSAGGGAGVRLAILKGGYKRIRELQNYPTNFVNFTISGQMWNDINVISNQSQHQNGIAIIGAKDQDNKDKLAGNTKRKGDILDLSEKEIEELKKQYNLGVLQIFRNNGL